MKKLLSLLLTLTFLSALTMPTMMIASAATPTTIVIDPLKYDITKMTWYSDSACTKAITPDLTKGGNGWDVPAGVARFYQNNIPTEA